jgi:prepilin-type N-terminal cleavage/methylation domain-containing protein
MYHPKQGFTLIELSIVLVIIGLLVGGILVGTDLIKAAEIRSVISQTKALNTAVLTFRIKYDQLPGDFNQATSFWPNTYNGNGNGLIEANSDPLPLEAINEWHQLAQAGLIPGDFQSFANSTDLYTKYPSFPFPPTPDLMPKTKNNYFISMNYASRMYCRDGTCPGGTFIYMITVPSYIANAEDFYAAANGCVGDASLCVFPNPVWVQQLDMKIDDGLPYSGHLMAVDDTNGYCYRGGGLNLYGTSLTAQCPFVLAPEGL